MDHGFPVWVTQPWRAVKVPESEVDGLLAAMEHDAGNDGLHAIIYPAENAEPTHPEPKP